MVYYRLRQVDRDGTVSYSPVRTVQVPALSGELLVAALPNPFDAHLTVRVTSPTAGPATVRIIDAVGRQLLAMDVKLEAGTTDLPFDAAAKLATGSYLLEVVQGASRKVIKVVRL